MGVVYLGEHTLLGRRAAIKLLHPMLSARPDIVSRFFNEARAVTAISDPGIVQVFDFGYHTDGSAFIVMEYLEGEQLDRRLARLGRLPTAEALRLCRQLANSLAAAHARRIVHRDLKPENVFLVQDNEVVSHERTKILDFGIAKLSDEQPGKLKTHTGVLMGTPMYMSPEQCRGLADVDQRSDIYALGCVLFHLLTGRPPFEGEGPGDIISAHIREPISAPSAHAPEIAPGVDALVQRCLAKAPADRFQTMTELGAAMASLLPQVPGGAPSSAILPYHPQTDPDGAPGGTPATSTTLGASSGQFDSAARWPRRLGLWIAGAFVVAAVVAGIAIVGARGTHERQVASAVDPASGTDLGHHARDRNGASVAADAGAAFAPSPRVLDATPSTAMTATDASLVAPPPAAPVANAPAPPKRHRAAPSRELTTASNKAPSRKAVEPSPPDRDPPPAPRPLPSPPQPPSPRPSPGLPNKCSKVAFAVVYNAAHPSKDAVRAALRSLNACHASGDVSDDEFEQTQGALVARL